VPHPGLDGPRIVVGVSEGVAASVPEHVGSSGRPLANLPGSQRQCGRAGMR
jgi:hypothetical protein